MGFKWPAKGGILEGILEPNFQETTCLLMVLQKPPRQEMMAYPFLQAIFTKYTKMIKSNYSLPHLDLSARPSISPPLAHFGTIKKKERKESKNKPSKISSFCSLFLSANTHTYTTKNQNTSK